MKGHVFQEVKAFKVQRYCKGCNQKMIVNNANRYYCNKCRGY